MKHSLCSGGIFISPKPMPLPFFFFFFQHVCKVWEDFVQCIPSQIWVTMTHGPWENKVWPYSKTCASVFSPRSVCTQCSCVTAGRSPPPREWQTREINPCPRGWPAIMAVSVVTVVWDRSWTCTRKSVSYILSFMTELFRKLFYNLLPNSMYYFLLYIIL